MERDVYGQGFRRARHEAAQRLARPDLMDMDTAAIAVGISVSMLQQLETGKKRPGFDTLEAMARAYNVLPGDLLPSNAPKGAEVDRIIAPLMTLPPQARSQFIVQMEAFARMIAYQINTAVTEISEKVVTTLPSQTYTPQAASAKPEKRPHVFGVGEMGGQPRNVHAQPATGEATKGAASLKASKRR